MNAKIVRLIALVASSAIFAMASSPVARAANTAGISLAASVLATCAVTQATGQALVFANTTGGIDPTLGTSATATTTITYKCTKGQAPSFAVTGAHDSGGNHQLVNGTNAIAYTVSTTSGGAGTGFGTGADRTLTLDGTITSTQYGAAPAATYSDTLTVSITP